MICTIIERTGRVRHPTHVLSNTRFFVGMLALIWLAGVMRCPLEAAGVMSNDYCCGHSSSAPAGPAQPARSQCSHDQSALSQPLRSARRLTLPSPNIGVENFIPSLSPGYQNPLLLQAGTDVFALARCWQFWWRTALEPRAPSSVS